MNNFEKTKYFNKTFGILVNEVYDSKLFTNNWGVVKYRLDLIQEEISELEDGIKKNSFLEVLDALADILYVVFGFGVTLGINIDNEFKKKFSNFEKNDFELVKDMYSTQDDGSKFSGKLEGANFEAIKEIVKQIRELYNQLFDISKDTEKEDDVKQTIITQLLLDITYFCYYVSCIIKVDMNYVFNLVHEANMTKACATEELAKATVEKYLQEKDSYNGEGEYPYQFPEYRASEDGKYWIIFNNDKRKNPKFAGKILKSMNWVEANFSEFNV